MPMIDHRNQGPYDDSRWQWMDDSYGPMGWFSDAEKAEHEGTEEFSGGHWRPISQQERESQNRSYNHQAYIQS